MTCIDLVACSKPIPSACFPSLGTTSLAHVSAVMTLTNSGPPSPSNGDGSSRPGDIAGMSDGDVENTCEGDRCELLKLPDPRVLTLPILIPVLAADPLDPDEVDPPRRCRIDDDADPCARTPSADRPFKDMICIASRTEEVPDSEISGWSGRSSVGDKKVLWK